MERASKKQNRNVESDFRHKLLALNRSAVDEAFHKLGGLVSLVEGKSFNSLNLLI